MDQRTTPSPRLMPLPPEHCPELKEQFEAMRKNLGFIPNSILIMQRKPKLAKALAQMTAAVWDPEGTVDRGFKRIIAHVASRAAGCQYCMAQPPAGLFISASKTRSSPRCGNIRPARCITPLSARRSILLSRPRPCPTPLLIRCLPNCAEAFFAKLTKKRLKHSVFRSLQELKDAIHRFLDDTNANPKPFTWTKDPNKIIAAVKRGHQVLDSIHQFEPARLRPTYSPAGEPLAATQKNEPGTPLMALRGILKVGGRALAAPWLAAKLDAVRHDALAASVGPLPDQVALEIGDPGKQCR